VLKIYKKEAIFGILDILVLKTVDGLFCLCLLPIIIKLTLFTLLALIRIGSEKIVKTATSGANTASTNACNA
jgi:hypothetical protein